ncbi:hypothetical protein [Halalkalibacter oceani]|uniref:hypothetical protein n=1 Tax=Halalkalibacter oceani TaxID=1653776 RepID=UPI0033956EB9
MEVKYIELIFENCESIIIPVERILKFEYGDLKPFTNDFYEENAYLAEGVELEVLYQEESDLVYNPFDYDEPLGMFVSNPMSNKVEDRPNILGRILNHSDIVCIDLLNEVESRIKLIYPPWSEEDDYNNTYEKIEIEEGKLKITIKKIK